MIQPPKEIYKVIFSKKKEKGKNKNTISLTGGIYSNFDSIITNK